MPKIKNHAKKKTTHYGEQKPEKVAEYKEQLKKIPKEKRIYVDEAGFDSYLYRKYARAPKGQKVHEARKGNKYQRTMHGDFFETWFEKYLLPGVPEDGVIMLDNASFHRKTRLYEIAEKNKRKVIFLPPYSPKLKSIEHFWHWLKRKTTDMLKFFPDLDNAIFAAFQMW